MQFSNTSLIPWLKRNKIPKANYIPLLGDIAFLYPIQSKIFASVYCCVMHLCLCLCFCDCIGLKLMTHVFCSHSEQWFLRQAFSENLNFISLAKLAGQWASRIRLYLLAQAGSIGRVVKPDFLCGWRGSKLRFSCCVISICPVCHFPSPQDNIKNNSM